jgi:hypothetical protein
MKTKLKYVTVFTLVFILAVGCLLIWELTPPKSWSAVSKGQTITHAYDVLGPPVFADKLKGFLTWRKQGILGAWLLIVYPDSDGKIASCVSTYRNNSRTTPSTQVP